MGITYTQTDIGMQWFHRHSTPCGSDAKDEPAATLPGISDKKKRVCASQTGAYLQQTK